MCIRDRFNSSLLAKRTRYSKTDADVLNANVAKVNTLNAADKKLIGNSYVVVLSESGTGVDTYVFKAVLNDTVLTEVWNNWLDKDASAANKSFYDNLKVDLEFVYAVNNTYESNGKKGSEEEVDPVATLNSALDALERKIDKWQVTSTISVSYTHLTLPTNREV